MPSTMAQLLPHNTPDLDEVGAALVASINAELPSA